MTYLSSIILFVTLLSSASVFAGIGCSWNDTDSTCNVAFSTCSDYTTWNTCARGKIDRTQNDCNALSPDCTWSVSISACTNNVNSAAPEINDCEYGACYAQMICSGADNVNVTSQSICDSRDKGVTPEDGIYGAWKQMECGQVGVAPGVLSNSGSRIGDSALLVILVTFLTTVASLKLV